MAALSFKCISYIVYSKFLEKHVLPSTWCHQPDTRHTCYVPHIYTHASTGPNCSPSVLRRCRLDYVACNNRPRNDMLYVGLEVKPYSTQLGLTTVRSQFTILATNLLKPYNFMNTNNDTGNKLDSLQLNQSLDVHDMHMQYHAAVFTIRCDSFRLLQSDRCQQKSNDLLLKSCAVQGRSQKFGFGV